MPEHFFDDQSRRRYSLFFIAAAASLGAILVPLAIISAIEKSDPLFGFTMILVYVGSVLLFQAFIAEYYFGMNFIEHVQAWGLPLIVFFDVLVLFLSRWIHPLLLAAILLSSWDLELFVTYRYTRDVMRRLGDHGYLVDGFLDAHRRFLPGLFFALFLACCGITGLVIARIGML
ncbi:MAG: hypothetical protein ACTSU5_12560 [Promethearchaeota archaeon]